MEFVNRLIELLFNANIILAPGVGLTLIYACQHEYRANNHRDARLLGAAAAVAIAITVAAVILHW